MWNASVFIFAAIVIVCIIETNKKTVQFTFKIHFIRGGMIAASKILKQQWVDIILYR